MRFPRVSADRWPWVWAAIVTLLILAVGGFLINQANVNSTVVCLNQALKSRDVLVGQLHDADVAKVQAERHAEDVKSRGFSLLQNAATPGQYRVALATYKHGEDLFDKALADYVHRSDAIRAGQLQHPFGEC